jgi:hypothetical protein
MAVDDPSDLAASEVVLLDPGPAGPAREADRVDRPGWGGATVVVLALLVLGAGWLFVSGGESPEAARPPVTELPGPPPTVPARPPTLAELTGLAGTDLVLAVGSHQGQPGRLLRWAAGRAQPEVAWEGVELRGARFDVSGRWVAGVGLAHRTGGGPVLWAGPLGGELEPVEIGVRGFAWHDTRPGYLAWSTLTPTGDGALFTSNLASASPHRRARAVTADLRLRYWGDWGYELAAPGRVLRSTVLDPVGAVVADQEAGFSAGWIPGAGVVLSSLEPPRGVATLDAGTGLWRPAPWAAAEEFVWDVAVTTDLELVAMQLASGHPRLGNRDGRVVVLDRALGEVARIDGLTEWAALGWSADGRTLVHVRQVPGHPVEVVLSDPRSGDETRITVPGLDPTRDRIEAVALVAHQLDR